MLEIRASGRDLVTLKEQQRAYLCNTRFDMDKSSMLLFIFTFFRTLRAREQRKRALRRGERWQVFLQNTRLSQYFFKQFFLLIMTILSMKRCRWWITRWSWRSPWDCSLNLNGEGVLELDIFWRGKKLPTSNSLYALDCQTMLVLIAQIVLDLAPSTPQCSPVERRFFWSNSSLLSKQVSNAKFRRSHL